MNINTLYEEHKAALEGYIGGPLGFFLNAPLCTIVSMYYRLNNEIGATELMDRVVAISTEDPSWWIIDTEEVSGLPDIEFFAAQVKHIVDYVWGVENPDKEGLQIVTEPQPDVWYLAAAEVKSEIANREYRHPAGIDGEGMDVKVDYSDAENEGTSPVLDFIGFYHVDNGFVFFDQMIGSLNIDEVEDYVLLRNWS